MTRHSSRNSTAPKQACTPPGGPTAGAMALRTAARALALLLAGGWVLAVGPSQAQPQPQAAPLVSPVPAGAVQPCSVLPTRAPQRVVRLGLLGHTTLARTEGGPAQHLGGISGLDLDPDTGWWWLLSDDKGDHAAPRAYPLRMAIGTGGISGVQVHAPVALPLYPGERADPEALRRHPCSGLWAWSSEGDVARGQAPSVRWLQWVAAQGDTRAPAADPTGPAASVARALGALSLPESLQLAANGPRKPDSGPRHNRGFEGLAFAPSGDALWIAMEGSLHQDGPEADTRRGAWVRFTRVPLAGGPPAQYAYPVGPIPQAASGGLGRADIGVSEILALATGELLVVERNGHELADGRWGWGARLYLADAQDATEVSVLPSLAGADIRPMRKRLLLDLAGLGLPRLDNIEAAAWGERLADGRAVLVLASDDNFSPHQATLLIALAVDELP